MTVDYAEVARDLEGRIAQLQIVLAAVNSMVGVPDPGSIRPETAPLRLAIAAKKKTAKKAAANAPKVVSGGDADAKARAYQLYMDGKKAPAIAKAVGRSVATIYGWSSVGKWKDGKNGATAHPSTNGYRRCQECGQKTPSVGSCNNCGAKAPAA